MPILHPQHGRTTLKSYQAKHYLLNARIDWDRVPNREAYPFNLPAISKIEDIKFHPSITFFVGENGSGKSTLVEALAVAWGFNAEGGTQNHSIETRRTHSDLHAYLRFSKSPKKAGPGFFLRAETLYNVASQIDDIGYMESYGNKSLHEQSHGESFWALLENKFRGNALYILDEPEAALSPARQISMLVRLHDLIKQNAQFIIATHSPILLAYPSALIYQVSKYGLEQVAYEDTEHFQITKSFLNRHEKMIEQLFEE
jgi:predicted ATPase